jgi:hypothetical protein
VPLTTAPATFFAPPFLPEECTPLALRVLALTITSFRKVLLLEPCTLPLRNPMSTLHQSTMGGAHGGSDSFDFGHLFWPVPFLDGPGDRTLGPANGTLAALLQLPAHALDLPPSEALSVATGAMVADMGNPVVLLPVLLGLLLSLSTAAVEESSLVFTGSEVWRLIFAFARVPLKTSASHSALAGSWRAQQQLHRRGHTSAQTPPGMATEEAAVGNNSTRFFCGSAAVLHAPDGSGPLFLQLFFQQLAHSDQVKAMAVKTRPGFPHTWGRSHHDQGVIFVSTGAGGVKQCVVSTAGPLWE